MTLQVWVTEPGLAMSFYSFGPGYFHIDLRYFFFENFFSNVELTSNGKVLHT